VFLTALPSLRLTATRAEVRSYLTATARTVLAGHWRRRFGLEITSIDVTEIEAAATAATPAVEPAPAGSLRLDGILARLPERYRAVLELRFLRALSMREVARELGISVSNAGVIQHRALRLAAELGRQEPGDGAGPARDAGTERLG
jgi:RNA polymerase sigma factor (sigma-70 family)